MENSFSPEDLRLLSRKYPKELAIPPLPSLDEMVVEFLRRHDVFVKPVGSSLSPGPLSNAAMGALGPEYVAVNAHLTQQQKSAALQEWTSWKQWALSHKDFQHFKDEITFKYLQKKENIDNFIRDNYDLLKNDLIRIRDEEAKRNKKQLLIVALLVLLAICAVLLASASPLPLAIVVPALLIIAPLALYALFSS